MRKILLIFVILPPLITLARTESPARCNIPLADLPLAPEIRIDGMLTHCSQKECDVSFEMDRKIGNFKFESLWLERKKKPIFAAELATTNSGITERAWIGAGHGFFKDLFIYAGYSNGENCTIVSKMEITHNKKRNELDATIVAPIR